MIEDLHNERCQLVAQIEHLKQKVGQIDDKISDMYMDIVKARYEAAGKDNGSLTVETNDPKWSIKANIRKTVKWDTDKLMAVASGMSWDQAQKLFQITMKMPERIYTALDATDPQLKMKIDTARTVVLAEPSLEVIPS